MLETKNGDLIAVEELSWNDTLAMIGKVLPEFTEIVKSSKAMKELSTDGEKYKFYKASYQFGDKIIADGTCYLPLHGGGSIAFNDPQLPDSLRTDLAYKSSIEEPLGLMLNKTSEFYMTINDEIQSHSLIKKGQMFGIPKAIGEPSPLASSALSLNLNAGGRSLFMLSKISDKICHEKLLQKYNLSQLWLSVPASSNDHWRLFVNMAKQVKSPWRCEILYFPRKWIEKLKTQEWAFLTLHIMNMHRNSYNVRHTLMPVWNATFGGIEQEKGLSQHRAQCLELAKRLFLIAASSDLGFKPATNDNSAPISLLQEMYTEGYGLASTVIMESVRFDGRDNHYIYFSLNHPPSVAQNILESANKKSQIMLLDEVARIVKIYKNKILSTENVAPSLYEIATNITFSYYHTKPQDYKNVFDIASLAQDDNRFSHTQRNTSELSPYAAFFKGCIRISKKS